MPTETLLQDPERLGAGLPTGDSFGTGISKQDLQAEAAGRERIRQEEAQQLAAMRVRDAEAARLRDSTQQNLGKSKGANVQLETRMASTPVSAKEALAGREIGWGERRENAVEKDPEEKSGFWGGLWNKTKKFAESTVGVVAAVAKGVKELNRLVIEEVVPTLLKKETWSKVGEGLAWVGQRLLEPETWKAAGELYLKALTLGPRAIAYAITHPVEALQKAGSFLKGMCDGLGLTDIYVGVKRLFRGDWAGAGQAFIGAGTAFVEFTGFADAYGAVKHFGQALICLGTGDKLGAAMHFSHAMMHGTFAVMSWGSIAATVATGGAAAGAVVGVMLLRQSLKSAAKQVIKVAAKEFFEQAGKEIGEQVVKKAGEALGSEVLQKTARESVSSGSVKVLEEVLGKFNATKLLSGEVSPAVRESLIGRLSRDLSAEHFEKVFREVGFDATTKLMKDAKIASHCEQIALDLFKDIHNLSKKELAQRLERQGIDPVAAKKLAKEAKKALDGNTHAGFFSKHSPFDNDAFRHDYDAWVKDAAKKRSDIDREIVNSLTQSIKEQLVKKLETEQRDVFFREIRQTLLGQGDSPTSKILGDAIRRQADETGRPIASLVDEYSNAAWKGYRRGMAEAVEAAVKEGVESALRKYRRLHAKAGFAGLRVLATAVKNYGESLVSEDENKTERVDSGGVTTEGVSHAAANRETLVKIRRDGDKTYKDVYVQKLGEDRWELDTSTEVDVDVPAAKESSKERKVA